MYGKPPLYPKKNKKCNNKRSEGFKKLLTKSPKKNNKHSTGFSKLLSPGWISKNIQNY